MFRANTEPQRPSVARQLPNRRAENEKFVNSLLQQATEKRDVKSRVSGESFGPWSLPSTPATAGFGAPFDEGGLPLHRVPALGEDLNNNRLASNVNFVPATNSSTGIKVEISVNCPKSIAAKEEKEEKKACWTRIAHPPTSRLRSSSSPRSNLAVPVVRSSINGLKGDLFFKKIARQNAAQLVPSQEEIKHRISRKSGKSHFPVLNKPPPKLLRVFQSTVPEVGIVGDSRPFCTISKQLKHPAPVTKKIAPISPILRTRRKHSPRKQHRLLVEDFDNKSVQRHVMEVVLGGVWSGESRVNRKDPNFQSWGISNLKFEIKQTKGGSSTKTPGKKKTDMDENTSDKKNTITGQIMGQGTADGQPYIVSGTWCWEWTHDQDGHVVQLNKNIVLEKRTQVSTMVHFDGKEVRTTTMYYGEMTFDETDKCFWIRGLYEYGSFLLRRKVPHHLLAQLKKFL